MSRLGREYTETQEKTKLRKREIDPVNNPKDRAVWHAIADGKHYSVAMEASGYTQWQVAYRCREWDLHASDYRKNIVRDSTKMLLKLQSTREYKERAAEGMKLHLRRVWRAKQEAKAAELAARKLESPTT